MSKKRVPHLWFYEKPALAPCTCASTPRPFCSSMSLAPFKTEGVEIFFCSLCYMLDGMDFVFSNIVDSLILLYKWSKLILKYAQDSDYAWRIYIDAATWTDFQQQSLDKINNNLVVHEEFSVTAVCTDCNHNFEEKIVPNSRLCVKNSDDI